MTASLNHIEVCESLHRHTPPEMLKVSELPQWKAAHESSQAGLFASAFSYLTPDPYVGEVISDFYLDFDKEDNPNQARKEAVTTIKKLIEEYKISETSIAIAFSGCKGFSVTVNPEVFNAQPSLDLPAIWKSIAKELQARLHLKTLDTGIYDRRRLWRMLNSKHNRTGLYKIPLTLTEAEKLSMEEIKTLAAKPREPFIHTEAKAVPEAERLYLEHKEKVETWLSVRHQKFETKSTGEDPPCIKKLIESGAQKGNRNTQTFQLALYYANKNLAQHEIENLCAQFAIKSDQPLSMQEITTIVDSAVKGYTEGRYSIGCSTFSDFCNKDICQVFTKEDKPNWDAIGEPISFDVWRQTIQANFPALWPYAEACASTIAVLQIQNVQPLALVLQGVPSGGKTTTLDFFRNFPLSHATDKFSPRAFVSHVAQKSEEELKKIDMLPRIKGKVLITPDLTTLFGAKAEDLAETFSILTRVLDGRGLKIDSGVYGSRGYEGDYMFSWIGASTPIPHKVWDLFGNLGARMYFMQILKSDHTNQDYIKALKEKNYRLKVNECNDATLRFLKGIWQDERIEWNSKDDPDELIDKIVQLSKIVTRLRGKINVVVKDGFARQEIFFTEAIIEEPDRCITALYSMMRGHALLQGRRQITIDDLPVVLDVALSSAPWDRILAFACVLSTPEINATQLEHNLRCSHGKALRTMQTLKLLDLVDLSSSTFETFGGQQYGYEMKLKREFKWFQSQEFKTLWRQKTLYVDVPIEKVKKSEPVKKEIENLELPQEPGPVENREG
jgi:hypothetical protein